MLIHPSPLPDVEIPDESLTEYVLQDVVALGDKPALIDGPSGRTSRMRNSMTRFDAWRSVWSDEALHLGDVVALMAPNIPEYAVVSRCCSRDARSPRLMGRTDRPRGPSSTRRPGAVLWSLSLHS